MSSTKKSTTAHFQLLKLSTQIKLGELTKHEQKLETHYTELLEKIGLNNDAGTASTDPREQLEGLYEGVKDLQVVQTNVHDRMEDVQDLVEFAAADPWSTETVVVQRKQQLLREIRQRRGLWQHNKLLGEMLMASLEETEHDQEDGELVRPQGSASGVSEDDVYEFLKTEVFQEREDFSRAKTQRQQKALLEARNELGQFGDCMLHGCEPVTEEDVTCCVAALLRDKAFLNPDVVALFTDAQRNQAIIKELSDVLTIELSNVGEWRWPEAGVTVDIQRGMNGRFRCMLQEEAITLLLFQYIGIKWSIKMKAVLRTLLDSVSENTLKMGWETSVDSVRATMMRQFQMFALADSMQSAGRGPYDENEDAADDEKEDEKADKQDIIRRLLVEAHLHQTLTTEGKKPSPLVAVMTDLEFFGPSVSHEAVFACLRFLGVRDNMLNVFRRYTEIPLLFPGFTKPKIMQRGLPVSRVMTMFLAEVELFAMDYLVLASSGVFLYRSHDDICFFDTEEAKVLRAWSEMQRYAQRVGLKFNDEKSGSIRLSAGSGAAKAEVGPAPLPATPIQWGLLELQSNGTVSIRQDEVTAFATEMADRLAAATSTFTWINVYNKYMVFFLRNFGKPSPIFGLGHIEDALSTLRRIHGLVFPKTNGDTLGYLREQITRGRHGPAPTMPAAWVYWPMNVGGLGLCNPFLAIWAVKESMYKYLSEHHTRADREWPGLKKNWEWQPPFSTVFGELKRKYELFAERIEMDGRKWIEDCSGHERFAYMKSSKFKDTERDCGRCEPNFDDTFTLRTFSEYVEVQPKVLGSALTTEFETLLLKTDECSPSPSTMLLQEVLEMFKDAHVTGRLVEWVAHIYSPQLMEEFGTLSFFSRELLPAQLIESIKKKAVTWQHVELQTLLKRSFIVWVCLCARTQLTDFVNPPELARRPPSIRKAIICHARALFAAIAANSLGTTIIRPIFGAAPQYEDTVRLVVPIYILVEVVVDVLRIPMPVLNAIVGLSVSWLKAFTIPKLVMEWQSIENAHMFAFVALSTANLYASGVVLRYLANYGRSHRLVELSVGAVVFILQIVGTSAVIGLVAHVASHFLQSPEKALEARILYFCVAWFALNKYWKKALGDMLVLLLATHDKTKDIKTS
ncbi:hypothetical protein BBJ29_009042 [Phytophthora kernoviae]|uniref:Reverse transcriptase domain-containing protein n=1 Tax=Phytophthora kernoviae TaxID=325452 RepID=A0A3F2RY83_9STRA|nr:hypothetical protein BBJ29_009042 [Phytophthora kernoviae]RLN66583.1 hypothetical protein BBP00_00002124 [Phytophthora kernoviae]